MALIPLTILVPLTAAGVLAAARPVSSRAFADAVALGASIAVLVLCAVLTHRSAHHDLVYGRAVLSGVQSTPAVPATRGPTVTSYVYGVGATIAAVALAAVALYVDRLPRPAARALAGLRALHFGRIGDYVAWLSVGVAMIGGAFALILR